MWTNCDDVQHAVQPSHGTEDACSPLSAPCISTIHVEKRPAGSPGAVVVTGWASSWRSWAVLTSGPTIAAPPALVKPRRRLTDARRAGERGPYERRWARVVPTRRADD